MLNFFESISSFFSSIWQMIQNTLEMIIQLFYVMLTMNTTIQGLVVFLPSIIGLSMSFVVLIAILKLVVNR